MFTLYTLGPLLVTEMDTGFCDARWGGAGQAELCHIITKSIFSGMEWGCGASARAQGLPGEGIR